jgi:hypothetical protein
VKGLIEHSSLIKNIPNHCEVEFVEKNFPLKHEKNLKDKYIIKVKSVFETITKVAEPQAKYKRKN